MANLRVLPREPQAQTATPLAVGLGAVVHLPGARRRYVVASGDPTFGFLLAALSGGRAGSGPSGVRPHEVVLDEDQTISFVGAEAAHLRRVFETQKARWPKSPPQSPPPANAPLSAAAPSKRGKTFMVKRGAGGGFGRAARR